MKFLLKTPFLVKVNVDLSLFETGGALAGKDVIANVNKLPPDTCKDYPHAERGTDFDINGKKKEKTSFITGDKEDDV